MDITADVTELDALLEKAGKRGYLWHMFRTDRHGPEVLAGVYQHPHCADVFVCFGGGHAHAYRLPTCAGTDVFSPALVYWWYGSSPVWTLRALLTLPAPGRAERPDALTQAPSNMGVPGDRLPVRMRRRSWL